MNNRSAIVVAAVVVIVVGAIVVVTLRGFASRTPAPEIRAQAAASPPTSTSTPTAAIATSPESLPWERTPDADTAAASGVSAQEEPLRAQQMRQLQQSMQVVIAEASRRSMSSNDHLRKSLDTLQQMNDPAVTSQINLDAVRQNLEVSIRMQALAQELQQLFAEPAGPTRQPRLDAKLAEFRRLQSQLRSDVRAAGAALPAAAAPASATAP